MPIPVIVLLCTVGVCLYFVIGAIIGGLTCRVLHDDVRRIEETPSFILPCLFWPIFLCGVTIYCLVKYPGKALLNIGEYFSKIGE